MSCPFYTADAFTDKPFHGAQVAVFPHAEGLDRERMQLIAREFNLTETVFLSPPAKETEPRRMHIFSPSSEVNFAGHTIIAAAYVLASIGEIPLTRKHTPLVLKLNGGPVQVYITGDEGKPVFVQFALTTRAQIDRFVPAYGELADILSIKDFDVEKLKYTPLLVSDGDPYLIVPLRSYEAVRKARFNFNAWGQSSAPATLSQEIFLFSTDTRHPSSDFHGRLIGPQIGPKEDPPISPALPAFAHYLCAQPQVKAGTHTFTIDRGQPATRLSVLSVEMDNKQTEELTTRVGGQAVLISEGRFGLGEL